MDTPNRSESSTHKLRSVYLAEMLGTLWPEPARITFPSRMSPAKESRAEFICIPNDRRPKLLVPRRPRRTSARAVRNYKMFATGFARAQVLLLSGAARLGTLDLLPRRIRIESDSTAPDADISNYLRDALSREIVICMYIGPPRAVQKPILQLLSPDAETFAFVKVGVDPHTQGLVRGEARSLSTLGAASLRHIVVPKLLHYGKWGEHEVLVQEALCRVGNGTIPPRLLDSAMQEIAKVHGTSTCLLGASQYWSDLRGRINNLRPSSSSASLLRAMDQTIFSDATEELLFGSWHGDWGPWNMTHSEGRLLAWDWEHFEVGVPVGFDAVHHRVQSATMTGVEPQIAFRRAFNEAPGLLAPFGIRSSMARVVVLLYAMEIATRYLHDGEPDHRGSAMGSLRWLAPVLVDGMSAPHGV